MGESHLVDAFVRLVEETGGLDLLRDVVSGRRKVDTTPELQEQTLRAVSKRIAELENAPLPRRRGFIASLIYFLRHRHGP